jgi:catechol 2,3-dioxygenase-like lactoylglutathione lyase family enzyme
MKRTRVVELDHVSLPVRGIVKARKFYEASLGAIGMKINMDLKTDFGMGSKKQLIFWVQKKRGAAGGAHHAFRVDHRAEVDAFYAAALEAGGADNGAPGLRPKYGKNYYAAFVHDPEGNNIEVVCYSASSPRK